MLALDSAVTAYLQGSGVVTRILIWVEAKNRTTGEIEELGLWTGEDNTVFTINGDARTYYGAQAFINVGELTLEAALNVRRLSIKMTPISPEMETVMRDYDPKMAPVEVHVALFNPETNNLVADPIKMHNGWIDTFPLKTPVQGGAGEATMNIAGNNRKLTKRLADKRSDDSQRRRNGSDTFYSDVSITGQVQTPWGSK